MKKTVAILLVALALLPGLAACAPARVQASLGQEFTLKLGQSARIQSEGLTLTFNDVSEDSRCPSGVT